MGSKNLCIYCTKSTGNSLEHIIPDAIGGSLLDGLFKTRNVCERCNNILGLFADGQYLKSFFAQTSKALATDLSNKKLEVKTLPMHYFGYMSFEDNLGYEDCEMWISQFKGVVFHFHNCRSEKFFGYAGGNPIDQKQSGGLALYLNVTDCEKELEIELRSFHKAFIKSERVVSHVKFAKGIPKALGRLPNAREHDWVKWYDQEIVQRRENSHDCVASVQLGNPDRMMAKIALGLGWNLFGEAFLESEATKTLRNYMWEKDFEHRQTMRVPRHDSFYSDSGPIFPEIPFMKKNVTILILSIGHAIIFFLNTFGDEQSIQLTDDPLLSEEFAKKNPDGMAYIVNPIYETVSGPEGMTRLFARAFRANSEMLHST